MAPKVAIAAALVFAVALAPALVGIPPARAQAELSMLNALGLGWNSCSPTNPVGGMTVTFDCEAETVDACRVFRLLPTFVSTISDPGFYGSTTTLEIRIAYTGNTAVVGQWWSGFVAGACRSTPAFSTSPAVDAGGTCANPYPGSALATSFLTIEPAGSPNRFRIVSSKTVSPSQALAAGTRTYAMQLDFKTEGTLADCDPALDNTAVCTDGCSTEACLLLKEVTIFMDAGSGNPNPDIIHYQHDGGVSRNFCFYQGNSLMCWNVPVRPGTWGQVKALYR